MNKNKGFPFLRGGVRRGLLLLLMLLPLCGFTQTLTQYEYWFDDDFAGRRIAGLSGKEKDLTVTIDTYFLETGLHRLNLRVKQSDGKYSAITTSSFLKVVMGEAKWLEYWFDGDETNKRRIEGTAASDGNGYVFNSEVDISELSVGNHQLFYRAVSDDGLVGTAVSVSPFLKLVTGEAKWLEYWFDGNQENSKRIAGTKASDGNGYVFNSEVDLSGLPVGIHQLYYRAVSDDGLVGTAVSVSPFLKLVTGEAKWLEYWFDGDRANKKRIAGTKASDGNGYVFNNELDVSGLDPGHHRLYYRAVSDNGLVSTSVSTSSVVVKLLGGQAYNAINTKVAKYSVSVDDEEPMVLSVLTPKEEITIPYTLDARELSSGTHTLKTKFWNSLNTSVSLEKQFTVTEPESPTFKLTAQEKDGLVLLKYSYVPNCKSYQIMRKDDKGANVEVYQTRYWGSPEYGDSYTDTPPKGNYTYYVKAEYYDNTGVLQEVCSNDVAINVAQSQDDLNNCGYIVGMISQNFVSNKWATIVFSDGVFANCTEGKFYRYKIPVGTVLTLEVEDNTNSSFALQYEPVTIKIKSGENFVYIKGQTQEDLAPNNYEHDLAFDSDIEWIGKKFKFMVKNRTKKPWKGYVRLRAISEKDAKKNEANNGEEDTTLIETDGESLKSTKNNHYYCQSDELTINSGSSAIVTLDMDNMFPDSKKDYYLMYIESVGKWTTDKEVDPEVKLVAINHDYNVTKNPMTRLIDKSTLEKAADQVLIENAEYAANLIMMVTGKIKAFDGILGNIEEFSETMLKKAQKLKGINFTFDKYNAYLERAFETESFNELLMDEMVQLLPQAALGEVGSAITKKLREDIKSDILSKAWDKITIKDLTAGSKFINEYLGKAMKILKYVNNFKEWDNLNYYDKHFYILDAIFKFTEKSNPYSKILKTYADVGQSMIRKALEYGEEYYGSFAGQYLYENIPSAEESSKFEYNKYVDFKIEVQTNLLVYYNFSGGLVGNGTYQIKDVKVMLSNRDDVNMVDTIHFEPIGVWNGVMLKQTRYSGIDPSTGRGNIEFGQKLKRMWMEIVWRNGRKSKIPLLTDGSSNGVDFVISNRNPYRYIVRLKSGTTRYENIADVIELKD